MTVPEEMESTRASGPEQRTPTGYKPGGRFRRQRRVIRLIVRRPAGGAAVVFLLLLLVIAVAAPLVAPHSPEVQNLDNRFAGSSFTHLLGTDEFGRDVFSRILYGARISLLAPAVAVGVGVLLGVPLGIWAGLRRGWLDSISGRMADTLLSLPGIVIALAVIAILGPGLVNVMLAVGIVFAPTLFRIVRASTMSVAEETFMESGRAIGCSTRRQMWVHALPNVAAPMLVQIALLMGLSLLLEASLSFIGLGVQPPTSSWGAMLKAAYDNQYDAPFAVVAPGLAICLTVLAFNLLGDSIRDVMAGVRGK